MDKIYDTKLIIAKDFESKTKYFDALGNITRIQIITLLLENPDREMHVDELAKAIYLSRPAISHHLKVLKECGMLNCRSAAQYNYYSINKLSPIWRELYELFDKVNKLLLLLEENDNE